METILQFIGIDAASFTAWGVAILGVIMAGEKIARLTKTKKDDKVFAYIYKFAKLIGLYADPEKK